ncbi:MAG: PAS domain S-box protein [Candidatus Riflebacteria bacterium]|nr:PAS domain S-box protein [Candidatus Riflebacteria bacterium]
MRKPLVLVIANFFAWLFFSFSFVCPVASHGNNLTKVRMYIKNSSPIQLPGYLFAKEKGFFEENGLDVEIKLASDSFLPLQMLLTGNADFAVGDSEILLFRMQGKPIVCLGAIFQHSPFSLLIRKPEISGNENLFNFSGKKIFLKPNFGEIETKLMLLNEGISLGNLNFQNIPEDNSRLLSIGSNIQVVSIIPEKNILQQIDFPPLFIRPYDNTGDFYANMIYTTQEKLNNDPLLIKTFRQAVIQGWNYALEHPQEAFEKIGFSKDEKLPGFWNFEKMYFVFKNLIKSDLAKIGEVYEERFLQTAHKMTDYELFKGEYSIDRFVYNPDSPNVFPYRKHLLFAALIAFSSFILVFFFTIKLKKAVNEKTAFLTKEILNRQIMKEKLSESEEKFRLTFEHAGVGMAHINLDNSLIKINDRLCKILNYSKEELINKKFQEIIFPEDFSSDALDFERLLKREINLASCERKLLSKNGGSVWVNQTVSLLHGPDGEPKYYIAIIEDISLRKQSELGLENYRKNLEFMVYDRSSELSQVNQNLQVEIAKRAKSEDDLKESEKKFKSIFESVNDGIIVVDNRRNILFENGAFEHIFEDEKMKIGQINMTLLYDLEKIFPAFFRFLSEGIQRAFESASPIKIDERFTIENKVISLEAGFSPIKDFHGNFYAICVIIRDISEKTRNVEALKESEERYRQTAYKLAAELEIREKLFRASPSGILTFDSFGQCVSANEAAAKIFGFSLSHLLEQNFRKIHSWKLSGLLPLAELCLFSSGDRNQEIYLEPTFGHSSWVDVRLSSFIYNNEKHLLLIANDITEKKLAEAALNENRQKFKSIFENMQDIYISVDMTDKIKMINPAALKELGYSSEKELLWKSVDQTIYSDPSQREEMLKELHKNNKLTGYEVAFKTKDGQRLFIEGNIQLLISPEGKPLGVEGLYRNITSRKIAEIELKRTMEDLQRSNNELEHFAHIASHDLQEPLRTMSSYLGLLEKKFVEIIDEKGKRYVQYVMDACERMQKQIRGLLLYSRVGTQPINLDESVSISQLIEKVMTDLRGIISRTKAKIEIKSELPQIKCDEVQIRQLFQNLFENAIKFSSRSEPEIQIVAELKPPVWEFCVSDNGIGIPKESHERIFSLFQRLHSQMEYPGTGIGLALCKRIIDKHQGKIWVDSEEGKGAKFYFTLPERTESEFRKSNEN